MEVIQVLLGLAAIVFVIGVAGAVLMITWTVFPMIAGAGLGIWLWNIGHDNLAVIAAIVGFIGQEPWNEYIDRLHHR
jgi:hypothetical protein